MKTLLAGTFLWVLGVCASLAQGTLVFSSGSALVRDDNGNAMPTQSAQVQFAWAEMGTAYTPWTLSLTASAWLAANPGWTVIGAPANVGVPVAGRFSGGTLTAQTAVPGALIQGVVIGWTGQGAADFLAGYQLALSQGVCGNFMVTYPFTVQTGNPTAVPAGTPGYIYNSTTTPFTGLWIYCWPEPSSFSLMILGGGVALIVRRRRGAS